MSKHFGTDGYRGRAGVDLTADKAMEVGRYLGAHALYVNASAPTASHEKPRILIGEDTRLSSPMLRSALAAGAAAAGADVFLMGVTTTPSVAFVARREGFSYGVMITASHNPYFDNGIKVMDSAGGKLSDEETGKIERYLNSETAPIPYADDAKIGRIAEYPEGVDIYRDFLSGVIRDEGIDLRGRTVVIDCAFGAAYAIAPDVLLATGAGIIVTGADPDGVNINAGAGSTHLQALSAAVRENHADFGFAYDGDADRCLMVDETGAEINGDQLIFLMALDLRARGRLTHDKVVLTSMSNLGVLRALEREGIGYEITDVGDKYVYECMCREGLAIGGEQSGHIIFGELATTGDGILTSIMVLAALSRSGMKASGIRQLAPLYPQLLKNIRVSDKAAALSDPFVLEAVREAEERLKADGRILIRPSGTEPLVRVMAEATSPSACEEAVDYIIDAVRTAGFSKE